MFLMCEICKFRKNTVKTAIRKRVWCRLNPYGSPGQKSGVGIAFFTCRCTVSSMMVCPSRHQPQINISRLITEISPILESEDSVSGNRVFNIFTDGGCRRSDGVRSRLQGAVERPHNMIMNLRCSRCQSIRQSSFEDFRAAVGSTSFILICGTASTPPLQSFRQCGMSDLRLFPSGGRRQTRRFHRGLWRFFPDLLYRRYRFRV